MERIFDVSIESILQAEAMRNRYDGNDDFGIEVQRLRIRRDPGLADLYREVTGLLPGSWSSFFKAGANITYLVIRFELDRVSPNFRIRRQDEGTAAWLAVIKERLFSVPLDALEEAERIIHASALSFNNIDGLGPEIKRFLSSREVAMQNIGLDVDRKFFYQLGAGSMLVPVLEKLGSRT